MFGPIYLWVDRPGFACPIPGAGRGHPAEGGRGGGGGPAGPRLPGRGPVDPVEGRVRAVAGDGDDGEDAGVADPVAAEHGGLRAQA